MNIMDCVHRVENRTIYAMFAPDDRYSSMTASRANAEAAAKRGFRVVEFRQHHPLHTLAPLFLAGAFVAVLYLTAIFIATGCTP